MQCILTVCLHTLSGDMQMLVTVGSTESDEKELTSFMPRRLTHPTLVRGAVHGNGSAICIHVGWVAHMTDGRAGGYGMPTYSR